MMATAYEGREQETDLGAGCSYVLVDDGLGTLLGAIEHHPKQDPSLPGLYCGGMVRWVSQDGQPANHRLVQLDPLTVEPSVLCRRCGHHGWIREGRWVPA